MMLFYWHVGKRINEDVLQGERSTYGKQVIPSVAEDLIQEHYVIIEIFPDPEIVMPLVRQLS